MKQNDKCEVLVVPNKFGATKCQLGFLQFCIVMGIKAPRAPTRQRAVRLLIAFGSSIGGTSSFFKSTPIVHRIYKKQVCGCLIHINQKMASLLYPLELEPQDAGFLPQLQVGASNLVLTYYF